MAEVCVRACVRACAGRGRARRASAHLCHFLCQHRDVQILGGTLIKGRQLPAPRPRGLSPSRRGPREAAALRCRPAALLAPGRGPQPQGGAACRRRASRHGAHVAHAGPRVAAGAGRRGSAPRRRCAVAPLGHGAERRRREAAHGGRREGLRQQGEVQQGRRRAPPGGAR